jgi:transcriptional regulator with XRE-family HTH domain
MTAAEQFAAWLAAAMRRADLDIDKPQGGGRAALAAACDVSRSTVSRWLDGKAIPSPEYFQPIADAVGVSVAELLIGAGIIPADSLGQLKQPRQVYSPEEAAVALGISPDDQELFSNFVQQLQKRARRTRE